MKSSRLNPPEPLTQALHKALDQWDLSSKLARYQVFEDWPRLVGKAIASKSRPTHYQGECLVVEVDHPAWIQELSLLKYQLLKKISKEYPKIKLKEIRFALKA